MKKGLINALILVLCLANVALSAVLVFTIVPAVQRTSTLVDRVCEIVNLDVGKDTTGKDDVEVDLTKITSTAITFGDKTTTTVNLKNSGGKAYYLSFGVSVNLNSEHEDYETMTTTIANQMSIINSYIIDVVSQYTFEGLDKAEMQNAVLKKLQDEYKTSCIYSVTFSPFTAAAN